MRVISNLTIIFYSIFFFLIGVIFVLMVSNVVSKDMVGYAADLIYTNPNMRLVIGSTGALLILATFLVIHIIVGKMRMERTIAFDNPDGQVTISLSAIEDFIRRLNYQLPEIKELKPTVIATKKGVDITTRLVLYSNANIPELTEKIQGIIKGRVLDILGIEEAIAVRIHIAKIVQKEEPRQETKAKEKEQVPFRGIEY